MIDFYYENAEHRERFEFIAFHDSSVKAFADYDAKMALAKERFWNGKDLPFPTLLDNTGTTIKQFGIRAFPTQVLIDPKGRLVLHGHANECLDALGSELAKTATSATGH